MKTFLKVDKELFGKGLTPIELLIYSQVVEFNTNTGDCFISDEKIAEQFGVSVSTANRAIKHLVELGYITKETKNVHNGKERHLKPTVKMTNADDDKKAATVKMTNAQQSNLPLRNSQNDLIKDNNLKDNNLKDNCLSQATSWGATPNPQPEAKSKKEFVF